MRKRNVTVQLKMVKKSAHIPIFLKAFVLIAVALLASACTSATKRPLRDVSCASVSQQSRGVAAVSAGKVQPFARSFSVSIPGMAPQPTLKWTPKAVQRVVDSKETPIWYCSREADFEARHHVSGKVQVRMRVEPNGRVSQACAVESTVKDPLLENCVISVAQRMEFPKRRDKSVAIAEYPFEFN